MEVIRKLKRGFWGAVVKNVWKGRVIGSLQGNSLVRMWQWTVSTMLTLFPAQ